MVRPMFHLSNSGHMDHPDTRLARQMASPWNDDHGPKVWTASAGGAPRHIDTVNQMEQQLDNIVEAIVTAKSTP